MKRISKSSTCPNPAGDYPRIDWSVYIDPTARVIGNVEIGPRVYVGPHAVIRADEPDGSDKVASIIIWPESNVQDGVIMHSLAGHKIFIGLRVSLSHGCTVHGPCVIGDGGFIGFRAVVFKATLGDGVYVGTGAIVEGVELPAGALVPAGSTVNSAEAVSCLPQTSEKEKKFMDDVVEMNIKLAEGYLGLKGKKS